MDQDSIGTGNDVVSVERRGVLTPFFPELYEKEHGSHVQSFFWWSHASFRGSKHPHESACTALSAWEALDNGWGADVLRKETGGAV